MHALVCSHPSAETAISEIVAVSVIAGAIVGGGVFLILGVGLHLFERDHNAAKFLGNYSLYFLLFL